MVLKKENYIYKLKILADEIGKIGIATSYRNIGSIWFREPRTKTGKHKICKHIAGLLIKHVNFFKTSHRFVEGRDELIKLT